MPVSGFTVNKELSSQLRNLFITDDNGDVGTALHRRQHVPPTACPPPNHMLQLLLFLLGTDGNVKGPAAAPVKGPGHNDKCASPYNQVHVDEGAAPMLRPGSTGGKHGWKGASSQDDDPERELHSERGYAPTLRRPTAAAAAATACASPELPPALRARLNTMCAIMLANGARIDGIELGYNQMSTPDGDVDVLGFRATRDLKPGETLLFVPYSLTLSSPVVRRGSASHLVRTLIDPAHPHPHPNPPP
jgi:hypothetical protein